MNFDWLESPFGSRTCGETLISAMIVLAVVAAFTTMLIPNHMLPHPAEWIPEEFYAEAWTILSVVIAFLIAMPFTICIAWDIRRSA